MVVLGVSVSLRCVVNRVNYITCHSHFVSLVLVN